MLKPRNFTFRVQDLLRSHLAGSCSDLLISCLTSFLAFILPFHLVYPRPYKPTCRFKWLLSPRVITFWRKSTNHGYIGDGLIFVSKKTWNALYWTCWMLGPILVNMVKLSNLRTQHLKHVKCSRSFGDIIKDT